MDKVLKRNRRKIKIRKNINGTALKPRVNVFKSNNFIFAQAIDDVNSVTLASASSLKSTENQTKQAKEVAKDLSEGLKNKKIDSIVFDRGGNKYHGVIKTLADTLRETGIRF
jgi:large subunit ribosomal protein L18